VENNPPALIDKIFWTSGFTKQTYQIKNKNCDTPFIYENKTSIKNPSDHFPIIATLEYN